MIDVNSAGGTHSPTANALSIQPHVDLSVNCMALPCDLL